MSETATEKHLIDPDKKICEICKKRIRFHKEGNPYFPIHRTCFTKQIEKAKDNFYAHHIKYHKGAPMN